jgi:ATP phosphoribosyltransferase regulatory subunit
MRTWVLPEYIEDILPAEAERIERLRRALLDLFRENGYELVMPPLLEYTDSLLTGTGHDLDLQTFKLVDQLSGRMMGLRADITPQVARIDAHLLNRRGVTRLCYCGSVLHTRPASPGATRELIQIGAEVYGHGGVQADLEIQALLGRALAAAGVRSARMDIGHVAVFRAIVRAARVGDELEAGLFEAIQKKDIREVRSLARRLDESRSCPSSTAGPMCWRPRRSGCPGYPSSRPPWRRCARSPGPARSRRASIWRSCAATTTTPAWFSTLTARG